MAETRKPLPEPFASMQRFITEATEAAERGEVQLFCPHDPLCTDRCAGKQIGTPPVIQRVHGDSA